MTHIQDVCLHTVRWITWRLSEQQSLRVTRLSGQHDVTAAAALTATDRYWRVTVRVRIIARRRARVTLQSSSIEQQLSCR